jgi:hypothetical protein
MEKAPRRGAASRQAKCRKLFTNKFRACSGTGPGCHGIITHCCTGLSPNTEKSPMPLPSHETETRVMTAYLLKIVGTSPLHGRELIDIGLDALARAAVTLIVESPNYNASLDRFHGCLEAALRRAG